VRNKSHDITQETHNVKAKENKTEKRRAASSAVGTIAATAKAKEV
jgi:hypothetical protein